MKNLNAERTYHYAGLKIHFCENKEVANQCLRLGDLYYLAVDIYILKDDEILHRYFRHFDKEVHMIHYQNFIKKFLRDPLYRQEYLAKGEDNWDGVLDLDGYKKQVNRYA